MKLKKLLSNIKKDTRKSSLSSKMKRVAKNPFVLGAVAAVVVGKLTKKRKNLKNATLYAPREHRAMYKKLIADLMRSGRYKRVNERRTTRGIEWELESR